MTRLRIGTRGSQLALWQARAVADRIASSGDVSCELITIRTSGDRLVSAPLDAVGGKRVFVKEIEDALFAGTIDLAVHSAKDMPALLPEELTIGAVLPREDPRDALVLPEFPSPLGEAPSLERLTDALGEAPRIGTSSVRRVAQLHRLWPHATFDAIRGNVESRLRKLAEGQYDAIVLAAAGLRRLGLSSRISAALPHDVCLPAPGQGIIAIEIHAHRDDLRARLLGVSDPDASVALEAERALVLALGGGCQLPLGALARFLDDGMVELSAVVTSLDGTRAVRALAFATRDDAASLGTRVAERLIADGAGEILDGVRDFQAPVKDLQP